MKHTCCNLGNRASGGAQYPYSRMVGEVPVLLGRISVFRKIRNLLGVRVPPKRFLIYQIRGFRKQKSTRSSDFERFLIVYEIQGYSGVTLLVLVLFICSEFRGAVRFRVRYYIVHGQDHQHRIARGVGISHLFSYRYYPAG